MELSLKPNVRRLIEKERKSGGYASAEDVVQAAMEALKQQRNAGDFRSGELNALIQEGERSIREEGVVPASEVFAELRNKSRKLRRARKAG